MFDTIWHHGKRYEDGKVGIRVSRRSEEVILPVPKEPKDITCIEHALAFILSGINLQRISGFSDEKGKYHRWSFSDCVGMLMCEYFFDTEKQVIDWAKNMLAHRTMYKILEQCLGENISLQFIRHVPRFELSQFLYSVHNERPEILTRSFIEQYLDAVGK